MKIYVASSWKNTHFDGVVALLRSAGHEVYDFRNPSVQGPEITGSGGFDWRDLGGKRDPKHWSLDQYRDALRTPQAIDGFFADKAAMEWAEACVLVLPSGKSAHMEFGWFTGRGKPVVAYLPPISKTCDTCKGTGRIEVHPNQFSGEESDRVCWTCPGTGQVPLWDFSPELMYLLGGPNVLAFTLEEILNNLRVPMSGSEDRCHECDEPIEPGEYGADGLICRMCVEKRDERDRSPLLLTNVVHENDKSSFDSLPLNGLLCSVCGTPQRTSPGGPTCASGHGGAPGTKPGVVHEAQKPFIFCSPEDLCRHGRSMDKPCVDCTLDEEANPPSAEDTIVSRLTTLLRGVADGLKGDPGPLKLHDWSDLPVIARRVREEMDENEGAMKVWRRRTESAEIRVMQREAQLASFIKVADRLRSQYGSVPGRTLSPMLQDYDRVRAEIPNGK